MRHILRAASGRFRIVGSGRYAISVMTALMMFLPSSFIVGESGAFDVTRSGSELLDQANTPAERASPEHASASESSSDVEMDIMMCWAPIWYQEVGSEEDKHYLDEIRAWDFDGDNDTSNNGEHAKYLHEEVNGHSPAYIYCSYLETSTNYFLGYYDYHAFDWKNSPHSDTFEHENDMEGVLVVVSKIPGSLVYGSLLCIETMAHDNYYQYAADPDLRDGEASIDGPVMYGSCGVNSKHPEVYVESGGHGVYGNLGDHLFWTGDWYDDFPEKDGQTTHCIKYVPTGTAEIVSSYDGSEVGYDLIGIDDPDRGLWKHRFGPYGAGNNNPLSSFYEFDGDPDTKAKMPWGWDDGPKFYEFIDLPYRQWVGDGTTFAGEIFWHPLHMIEVHFNGLPPWGKTYYNNPYAIELHVDWVTCRWDCDGANDASDPYFNIWMYDGKGECDWGYHDVDWNVILLDPLVDTVDVTNPYNDGVLDGDSGIQRSWIWWHADEGDTTETDIYLYGVRYPDKPYFKIRCRDWDEGSGDEWLMDPTGTYSYGGGYSEVKEGRNRLDWEGSSADIILAGDVNDDDTQPPQFGTFDFEPGTVRVESPESISFSARVSDMSGIESVKLLYSNDSVNWREHNAWKGAQISDYTVEIKSSLGWDDWAGFGNSTIWYKWWARDGDNDRPYDSLEGYSCVCSGPDVYGWIDIGLWPCIDGTLVAYTAIADVSPASWMDLPETGVLPKVSYRRLDRPGERYQTDYVGVVCSVSYPIIAFHTYEGWIGTSLNGDSDTTDWIVQCLDTSNDDYCILGEGKYPSLGLNQFLDVFAVYQKNTTICLKKVSFTVPSLERDIGAGERPCVDGSRAGGSKVAFCTRHLNGPYTISYMNISSIGVFGPVIDTGVPGVWPRISGSNLAFTCNENWLQCDIDDNGDLGSFPAVLNLDSRNLTLFYRNYTWLRIHFEELVYGIVSDIDRNRIVVYDLYGRHFTGNLLRPSWHPYIDQSYEQRYPILKGLRVVWANLTGDEGGFASINGTSKVWQRKELDSHDFNGDRDLNDCGIFVRYKGDILMLVASDSFVLQKFLLSQTSTSPRVSVTFQQVISNGTTILQLGPPGMSPSTMPNRISAVGESFCVATTAATAGPVRLSRSYDPSSVGNPENLKMMRFDCERGEWVVVASSVDTLRSEVFCENAQLGEVYTLVEWSGMSAPRTLDEGGALTLDNDILAFGSRHSGMSEICFRDLRTNETTHTGLPGYVPSISGRWLVFQSNETWDPMSNQTPLTVRVLDLELPDGDFNHSNITFANQTREIAVGQWPDVDGDIVAFVTDERQLGMDLNEDNVTDDLVIRYQSLTSNETINTGQTASRVKICGQTIFFVRDSVLMIYDIQSDEAFNTGQVLWQLSGSASQGRVAFNTREWETSQDLNHDGDTDDLVIGYCDSSTRLSTFTTCMGYLPQISGDIISFTAAEELYLNDLNGDGDFTDYVLAYYNTTSNVMFNTREYCLWGSCPDGNLIAYIANETVAGCDLNADGDLLDDVISYVHKVILPHYLPPKFSLQFAVTAEGVLAGNPSMTFMADISAGALPSDSLIAVNPVSNVGPPLAPGLQLASEVYMLGPVGMCLGEPATVVMTYDDSIIPETTEKHLRLWYSPDSEAWHEIAILHVDPQLSRMTFRTWSFGYFAAIRDDSAPISTLIFGPPSFTDFEGKIHVTPGSSITLEAIDTGSSVSQLFYHLDDGNLIQTNATFRLEYPAGEYTLEFFSVDAAGNVEQLKSSQIVIESFVVRGVVFSDRYDEGILGVRDVGELGLAGFELRLEGYSLSRAHINLTTVSASGVDTGFFSFPDVPNGDYWLNMTAVSGYSNTTAMSSELHIPPDAFFGLVYSIDFGMLSLGNATPTVATVLSSSSITLGESVTDMVTVTGSGVPFPVPTGTVQFQVRVGTGSWLNFGSPVTLVNGSATSDPYTPLNVGPLYYHFKACYSGDGSYNATESGEDDESLTVEPATPTIATLLSSSSITLGKSVTDTVTMTGLGGAFPMPTGTVQFQVQIGEGPWTDFGPPVALVNGSATSDSYTPVGVGPLYYHFKACYGGDGNYDPAESGEDEESLTVEPATPTIVTLLSSSLIVLGESVTDTVTVTGLGGYFPEPTGTVQFQVRTGDGPWIDFGSPVALVNGSATSDSYTPIGVGRLYYHFKACYGGDGSYDSAESGEDDEPLTVAVCKLSLVKGWNFVTVPTVGFGYKASTLGLQNMSIVVSWSPAAKAYDKTFIVGVSPPVLDFAIQPSTGYWVFVGTNQTLYFQGTLPTTTQTRAVTVPTGGGWVNMAFNTLNTTWKASMVPGMYSGGNVTMVAWYDATSGTYKTYIKGIPQSDFTLIPGQAYWVMCTASGTFTYTP